MSRRFLALWLPHFATDRLGLASGPLAILAEEGGVPCIIAANQPAAALGIQRGMALADARALYPGLATRQASPLRESHDLAKLSDWCGRYSPLVAPDGTDGLMLDTTGCDHLFGGEAAMLAEIVQRMHGFGYSAAAALAPTPGAAWALARYGKKTRIAKDLVDLPHLLTALPTVALRLPAETAAQLAQVGLRCVGDLLKMPRAPLAKRFGAQVPHRLGQALGHVTEAIAPRHPPAPYRLRLDWMEPLRRMEDLAAAAEHLLERLCEQLAEAGRGVRCLLVTCHSTNGHTERIEARTSAPVRCPVRLLRLLEANLGACDLGFGIETMILSVARTEPLAAPAPGFWRDQAAIAEDTATLIDRLSQRLGERKVRWSTPVASHIPERAVALLPALRQPSPDTDPSPSPTEKPMRPLRLLLAPEPVEATALLPDHPPAAFRWRRVLHRVRRGAGPERIAPEWWRDLAPEDQVETLDTCTRDYYAVEDEAGQRFWLFRQGLYDRANETETKTNENGSGTVELPAWFVQGVLA
ncbi:MAG TPA: DNA polymerase Y family protein [Alphaproteobacteria bacterium]|nr:DNA polymerase Y family protein [Alphaproteobacteria bacterium]